MRFHQVCGQRERLVTQNQWAHNCTLNSRCGRLEVCTLHHLAKLGAPVNVGIVDVEEAVLVVDECQQYHTIPVEKENKR